MHRLLLRFLQPSSVLGGLVFAAAALNPAITKASSPFLSVPDPATVETTAAYRYANMTNDEAIAELNRRSLPYVIVADPVPGVRAPIRLTGRLHGVLVHSGMPANQRTTSPFEILDARLALALDDFTAILEKHDIDEIEHFSMYRPNVAHKPAPPKIRIPPVVHKPAETLPNKPDEPTAKLPADKPPTTPIAKRNKIIIPRVAKKPTATSQPKKPQPKIIIRPKTKPKVAPVAAEKPIVPAPVKGQEKPAQRNVGKAGLGPKTTASDMKKGAKQKAPGESDDTAETNKPVEIVTEPPEKEAVSAKQTTPAVAPAGTRHPGGLAIDVGKLRKKDGTWITVAAHFHGKIGDKACGEDAPVPANIEARELRALVCEAMGNHIFTYVLTPNYNAAHADHFHMEIKPGVKWFLVH